MPRKYIMVCDERGTTRWPSRTRTWAWGGFIIDVSRQALLAGTWEDIKHQLCGDSSCELKWSHFFPGRHQEKGANPLLSDDPAQWRVQASWAVNKLLEVPGIRAITSYIRKDEASDAVFRRHEDMAEKDYRVLNIDLLWVTVYGQFALYLHERRARGEIWFDRLGSPAEEQRRQADWCTLRDNQGCVASKRNRMIKRIDPQFKFLDSKTSALVQVADFVSGVIWAASEDDEVFLLQALEKYFPTGPKTYTLARIQ